MKIILTSAVLTAALVLAGCASKPTQEAKQEAKQEAPPDCSFQMNTSQRAPLWVCGGEVPGFKDVGIGTYAKSAAGYQFSVDQATAVARVALASQISSRAEGMVKSSVESQGTGSAETVDAFRKTVVKTITAETLAGSKVVRTAVDALGNVYVAVGMDLAAANKKIEQSVQSSMKNESAIWQKMLGNKSQAEMTDEIMKLGK